MPCSGATWRRAPTSPQTLDAANVVEVPVLHPRDLPDADIIKVDLEGTEGPIVAHMDPARLERVSLILMEYQDDQNLAR